MDRFKSPKEKAPKAAQIAESELAKCIDLSTFMGTVPGKIGGKTFTLSTTPELSSGRRKWLIISLQGQDKGEVVSCLSKLLGYGPFCRYLHKDNASATATYEWDSVDPQKRYDELSKDGKVFELSRLGKESPAKAATLDVAKLYQEFTPRTVALWEAAVKDDPRAEWCEIGISKVLPFIRKAMPRIGKNQSMFGLSIISIEGAYSAEEDERIVRYGLEPLVKSGILNEGDVKDIVAWYQSTKPSWDSGSGERYEKKFGIDGQKYRLVTDSYRNCRDLNLQID